MTWQEPWCIFSTILLVLKLFLVLIIFFLFHIIKMISTENLIDIPCKNSSISSSREKISPSCDIAQALLSAWQIESLYLLSSTIDLLASKNTNVRSLRLTHTQPLSGMNSIANITPGQGMSFSWAMVKPSYILIFFILASYKITLSMC